MDDVTARDVLDLLDSGKPKYPGNSFASELNDMVHKLLGRPFPSSFQAQYEGSRVPNYSGDVNAAMALLPREWAVAITRLDEKWLVFVGPKDAPTKFSGQADTQAKAILVAAMKMMEEDQLIGTTRLAGQSPKPPSPSRTS